MSEAHTQTIWLAKQAMVKGRVPLRIAKFFIHPIARSTWILTDAIFCVCSISASVSYLPLLTKDGMFRSTPTAFS